MDNDTLKREVAVIKEELAKYTAVLNEGRLEMLRSVLASAAAALKSAALVNGGAAVALLTRPVPTPPDAPVDPTSPPAPDAPTIFDGLPFFTWGILAVTIANGTMYVAQYGFAVPDSIELGRFDRTMSALGRPFQIATMLLTLASYCLFVWGARACFQAI